MALLGQIKFSGLTPLFTSLRSKIIDPLVIAPARQNALQKPVLVIVITDGEPAGDQADPHGVIGGAIQVSHRDIVARIPGQCMLNNLLLSRRASSRPVATPLDTLRRWRRLPVRSSRFGPKSSSVPRQTRQ